VRLVPLELLLRHCVFAPLLLSGQVNGGSPQIGANR
jgi:hypothetical protein